MDIDTDTTVFPCSDVREKIAKDPDLRDKLIAQRAKAARHKRVTGPKANNSKPKDSKGAVKDLRETIKEKRARSKTPAPSPKVQSEVQSTGDAKRPKKANNGVALPKPPPATTNGKNAVSQPQQATNRTLRRKASTARRKALASMGGFDLPAAEDVPVLSRTFYIRCNRSTTEFLIDGGA